MWVLVRMALRNLVAHKAKSLIVGSIIAFGVMVLLAGISFMDTAAVGLRKSFIENFTGDVIITGNAGAPVSLFGVQSMGGTESTPLLPRYDEVLAHVRSQPGVRAVTPQVTGASQINMEGNDSANVDSLVFMFGIDPDSYRPMFDNLDLRSGRYLQAGEQGILLSSSQVASLDKELKAEIKVGDTVIVQNFGTAIRAVTVRGIFDYKRAPRAQHLGGAQVRIGRGFELGRFIAVNLCREVAADATSVEQRRNLGTATRRHHGEFVIRKRGEKLGQAGRPRRRREAAMAEEFLLDGMELGQHPAIDRRIRQRRQFI